MSVLVGWGPEARGRGGLELGRMLATSAEQPLVVCCVIPDRWEVVGAGRAVDRHYHDYLRGLAAEALDEASTILGDAVCSVRYEVVTARSAPVGLLRAAAEFDASILVAGSSSHGAWGHIALGSATGLLLHSASLPVALAPRGWTSVPDGRVRRITVAVDGSPTSTAVLRKAADLASWLGAQLRITTFAVRAGRSIGAGVGPAIEDRVVAEWMAEVGRAVDRAVAAVDLPAAPERSIVEARSWAAVMDAPGWVDGEVLVLGSSAQQPVLSRVFLGSTASRIIRHAPVPVVLVP